MLFEKGLDLTKNGKMLSSSRYKYIVPESDKYDAGICVEDLFLQILR